MVDIFFLGGGRFLVGSELYEIGGMCSPFPRSKRFAGCKVEADVLFVTQC